MSTGSAERSACIRTPALWSEPVYLHFCLQGRYSLFTNVGNALMVRSNDFLYCGFQINLRHGVPFNLHSLGHFLKQLIEHYPKLNCICYPFDPIT